MGRSSRSVVIVGDKQRDGVAVAAGEIEQMLRSSGFHPHIDLDEEVRFEHSNPEYVIVLGGDGAMLGMVRRLSGKPIKIIGVNFGRLGFMSPIQPHEMLGVLKQMIVQGKHVLSPRMLLAAYKGANDRESLPTRALNEVVIRAREGKTIHVTLSVDGEDVTTYGGDGLIIATPTGSTAYNLSAGGSIAQPEMQVLFVTPICCARTAAPLVVSAESRLLLQIGEHGDPGEMLVDGQVRIPLTYGQSIFVRKSNRRANLLIPKGQSFFRILHRQLGFDGQPPGYPD